MGKFSLFVFALVIFIGIGLAVHRVCDDANRSQKQVSPAMSEKESAGEKISIEELASKGEKVSLDEALLKIEQANAEIKEQAEKFSIRKMIARVQKDGPAGLVAHFRGERAAKIMTRKSNRRRLWSLHRRGHRCRGKKRTTPIPSGWK